MTSSAREFFEGIESRVDPAQVAAASASYRFDVGGAGSWHVAVGDGKVVVEESDAEADCVILASEETLMKIVRGEANPMTAYLTGKLKIKGDTELALKLKDLFF